MRYRGAVMGVCLLCGVVTAAPAAVYRWVDDSGQVHYSDTPPASRTDTVTFSPGTAADAAERRAEAEAERSELARQARCDAAREQFEQYRTAVRLVERDSQGNERELTADERARLVQSAQTRIESECEGPE